MKLGLVNSHLVLAHQPPSSVEALRGYVAHVHLSDCDGKVHGDLPPGRGVVDRLNPPQATRLQPQWLGGFLP
jgi:D-psicose/D-tagatose/L-ribulose 3-epimerase